MATWADVVALGSALPEVQESTWYRTPALKVRGKGFCRLKEDGETLVVRVVDLEDKEALLQAEPERLFTTPHYDGHPYVLVHLAQADDDLLGELLEDAWRCRAPPAVRDAADSRRPS
jgi:hypothetical protein